MILILLIIYQCENNVLAPGTPARLICDWLDLHLGDVVHIIRFDANQGYLVRTSSRLEEVWLPPNVLSYQNRKPWSFRFRKPSFSSHGRKSVDCSSYQDNIIMEITVPEFRDKMTDLTIQCGTKAMFQVRIKHCGKNVKFGWRKTEPDPCVIRQSGRFLISHSDNFTATLTINNARVSDSGTYLCIASNEIGSAQCSAKLVVTDSVQPVNEPTVQIISCSSVSLQWESDSVSANYLVEYCKVGSAEWLCANLNKPVDALSFMVEHLMPGETYSFRIISLETKLVGPPSVAVTLPVADSLRWQQEQFKRRYTELEEIGRGRFSVIRKAKDRGTGHEVALKQISRRKQPHKVIQAEYALLASMQHANIIRAMALFDNAPEPGIDTIVLEL